MPGVRSLGVEGQIVAFEKERAIPTTQAQPRRRNELLDATVLPRAQEPSDEDVAESRRRCSEDRVVGRPHPTNGPMP